MSFWKRIVRVFTGETEGGEDASPSSFGISRVSSSLDKGEATITVISSVVEDGKIQLEVDWTDKFIDELAKHGYTGSAEEKVHRYLATLHQQMMTEQLNDPTRFD